MLVKCPLRNTTWGDAHSEYTEALFNWAAKKDAAERELRNSRPREVVIDDAVKAA